MRRYSAGKQPQDSIANFHLAKTKRYCNPNDSVSTSVPDMSTESWILPRANKVSTGHFVAPVCALVPPFRIYSHPLPIIKATPIGVAGRKRMRDSIASFPLENCMVATSF